jgi:UMF1 family MFS transporter
MSAAEDSVEVPRSIVVSAPVTRREIMGWCFYDVADSAFTTVIVTVFYALYFKEIVVGDDDRANFLWALATSVSEIAVALTVPILGAIADFSGSRKRFLGACAGSLVLFTGLLYFAGPGMTALAFVLFVAANVSFTGGGVFIDSFLPGISNATNAGRISGLKWALGSLGGLTALAICLPLAGSIRSNPSPEQLAKARLVPVIVAAFYAVAVIPTFLFLKERSIPQPLPSGENYLTVGFRRLLHTLKQVRQYRELAKLLLAFLVYNDGIVTVIFFAGIYAEQTIGFTVKEIGIMFILMNVVALAGALSFGWLADRLGQKRTILISLCIWLASVIVAFLAHSKETFYVAAGLAGVGIGSSQSVTRSLVALFTPKENAAEFAGFLGFTGKAAAFIGPMLFGTISSLASSQRPAILTVAVFFIVGGVLLTFVDEEKGKAASKVPVR